LVLHGQDLLGLDVLLADLVFDVGFYLLPLLDAASEHLQLVFQVVDLPLVLIYRRLFLRNLGLLQHIFLPVDQVLKLPCLADSRASVFEPLQVGLNLLAHILRGDLHLVFQEAVVGDSSLLACQEFDHVGVHLLEL